MKMPRPVVDGSANLAAKVPTACFPWLSAFDPRLHTLHQRPSKKLEYITAEFLMYIAVPEILSTGRYRHLCVASP